MKASSIFYAISTLSVYVIMKFAHGFSVGSQSKVWRNTISHSNVRSFALFMSSDSSFGGSDLSKYLLLASKTNEKVKLLKALQLKKTRDNEGLLLLEGHRQIIDAINSGYFPSTLLLSEEAVSAPLGRTLLDSLKKCAPSTVFRAPSDLIQSISDTVSCQGVVASFAKPKLYSQLPQTTSPLIVLMDRPNDPGNLGTIIRTAYGMGVDAVIIVDGCDPWSPKVLRSAMGMCLKLPLIEASWKDGSISQLLLSGRTGLKPYQILLADADPSGQVYHKVDMTGPTIIVVGSEASGIGAEARTLKDKKYIRIPTSADRQDLESFNAAVACSILVAEAARQRMI